MTLRGFGNQRFVFIVIISMYSMHVYTRNKMHPIVPIVVASWQKFNTAFKNASLRRCALIMDSIVSVF